MTFDAADGAVLLFAGFVGDQLNTTWEYNSTGWSQVSSAVTPPLGPQSSEQLTYDAADGYPVLFEGCSSLRDYCAFNASTWTFSTGQWHQLNPANSPPGRDGPMMTYDASDGYVLLFGGVYYTYYSCNDWATGYVCPLTHDQNDTWKFLGGNWTNITGNVSHPPRARDGGSMVYDPPDRDVILFGGENGSLLNDTWSFANGSWTNITPAGPSPSPRVDGWVTFDAADRCVLLWGGGDGAGNWGNDTWEFQNGSWNSIRTVRGPTVGARPISYDPIDGFVISFSEPEWRFHSGNWTVHGLSGPPTALSDANMVFDAADGYVLLFAGGTGGYYWINETWTFDAGNWTDLTPRLTVAPEGRVDAAMAYDARDGYVVLFSGQEANCTPYGCNYYYNNTDTWTFHAGAWSDISAFAGQPPLARAWASFGFDVRDGYLILFGGIGGWQPAGDTYSPFLNDTWRFSGGVWSNISDLSARTPSGRASAGLAYDATDGYELLFGGYTASSRLNDTWSFAEGRWAPVFPAASPPPSIPGGLVYDESTGEVLLLQEETGRVTSTTVWSYAHGTWTDRSIAPNLSPPGRWNEMAAYDPVGRDLLLVGGYSDAGAGLLRDDWTYSGTGLSVHVGASQLSGASPLSVRFNATVLGGQAPYRFTWQFGDGSLTNGMPNTTHTFWATGSTPYHFAIEVGVSDSSGLGGAGSVSIEVSPNRPLRAGFPVPSQSSADAGQSVTFTATPMNGSWSYFEYVWNGLPVADCLDLNSARPSCRFGAPGNFTISYDVTDTNGSTATSPPLLYSVFPDPTFATAIANRTYGYVGENLTVVAAAEGGTNDFVSYRWFGLSPEDCIGTTTAIVSCVLTSRANLSIRVSATDSNGGETPWSLPVMVIVYPGPGVPLLTWTRNTADVGQEIDLIGSASGGTGVYRFLWEGLPEGCANPTDGSVRC